MKWIGVVVSLLFLWLLYQQFAAADLHTIQHSFGRVKWSFFTMGILFMVLSAGAQAYRWRYLLHPLGSISLSHTFSSVLIGHWMNLVLPFRAGELARPYALSKLSGHPFSTVLASSILERLLDGMCILLLLLVSSRVLLSTNTAQYALLLVLLAAGLAVIAFLGMRQLKTNQPFTQFSKIGFNAWLQGKVKELNSGLRLLSSPGRMAGVLVWTLIIWAGNVVSYWLLIKSCHLPEALQGFMSGLALTATSGIAHAIPSSASGVGVINYGVVYYLQQLALYKGISVHESDPQLLAASVVVYVATIIPDLFIGGFCYFRHYKTLNFYIR